MKSPISGSDLKQRLLAFADDVGFVRFDHPAIAHERDEMLYVYPHTYTLICLVSEENKAAMQSRYLPTANHELYGCEERLFQAGHQVVKLLGELGGNGLTTTVGWPQEVSQRWADKIWPLSHKLVAQAAGLGVIGTSRNFLHPKFGAYCLLDTVLTDLVLEDDAYTTPMQWNPCVECNLCVASCPTDAIGADGDFDFFACYNHTYRDSIPGFLDLVRDLGESRPKRFEKRWSDAEIAALWQSMAFKVEYRCFNCVATCPAEIHGVFHADKSVRKDYLRDTLKPLTHTRRQVEEQFVIDTPSAREAHGIPPGEWRTPIDRTRPTAGGIRLVQLQRIRTSNVDSMMRSMPHYFRSSESKGLEFTCQFDFAAPGPGHWTLQVAAGRCVVEPGSAPQPDLRIECAGELFLRIHRGEASALTQLMLRRLHVRGDWGAFLAFPRIFPTAPAESRLQRWWWQLRRRFRP